MQKLVLIALAGSLGTLSRYGLTQLVHSIAGHQFPWGTFVVNITGCFLFGLTWTFAEHLWELDATTRAILLTGFMGAFTTFSTFIFESDSLMMNAQWLKGCANLIAQIVLGLMAMQAGQAAARFFDAFSQ